LTSIQKNRITDSERRLKILECITERQKMNQKTTKAVVMRYMKEKKLSSGETTHNIIKDLINEGKLNMEVLNSQVHFLTINENNEFNKIYNILTKFEVLMNTMNKIVYKNKLNLDTLFKTLGKEHEEYLGAVEVADHLVTPYIDTFEEMLKNILIRIVRSNISEKDNLILASLIIHLLNKLTSTYVWLDPHDLNSKLKDRVSWMRVKFPDAKYIQGYAKKYDIDLNVREDLIIIIEKFRKEFLA